MLILNGGKGEAMMEKVSAVVLGGRRNDGKLREVSQAQWESLIEINGRPMVGYVLEALRGCRRVEHIALVGPAEASAMAAAHSAQLVPPSETLMDALTSAAAVLPPDRMMLVTTSDIPLVQADDIEEFLKLCDARDGQFYYSIVPKAVVDTQCPGSRRTYYPTDHGPVTGGNAMLVHPDVLEPFRAKAEFVYRHRKNPVAMGLALGFGFVVKTLITGLTLDGIEQRFSDYLGLRARAIVVNRASIGVDVDKPEDYRLASEILSRRHAGAA